MNSFFKISKLILLFSVAVFLFIYPWTKEPKHFRAEDVNWEILKSAGRIKKFDFERSAFVDYLRLGDSVRKLNGKKIIIKGFYKKELHEGKMHMLLTETVTDVCFMCSHDEHYEAAELIPEPGEGKFFESLKDDEFIRVSGIFVLCEGNDGFIYRIENAKAEILSGDD